MTYSQANYLEREDGTSNSEVITQEKEIPQYLLDQLEIAQRTENVEEENRIMNILNSKYFDVTFYNSIQQYDAIPVSGEDVGATNPPYNPDWMSSDRLFTITVVIQLI